MLEVDVPGSPFPQYDLALADGSRFTLLAQDEPSSQVTARCSQVMRLRPHSRAGQRLLVTADGTDGLAVGRDDLVYVLRPIARRDEQVVQMWNLAQTIACAVQPRGGVLLHGALAEWRDPSDPGPGQGVILAAPGNTGKTTASQRLPLPWHSLCDDATLVVYDQAGTYWAHPWPTWSQFLNGEAGDQWDVQRAVPLKSIFFLSQAQQDYLEAIGPGQAASRLVQHAEQAANLFGKPDKDQVRRLRLERFENLCALARVIPAYLLSITLTGSFWQEMERALHV